MGKKRRGKNPISVSNTNISLYLSPQISQSETKHETKEESQLEEGASIPQDKLSLQ